MMPEDPYALENLLPAGTVLLHLESETTRDIQPPVDDNWETLNPFLEAHDIQLTRSSLSRLQELEFLVEHRFVRATWRALGFGHPYLHIRLYLIPFDLPGVCGHLTARNRDETRLLLPARKALVSLLRNTNRSPSAWTGNVIASASFEPFIVQELDERTLSEIYSDLPSPTVNAVTFLSGANVRIRDALQDALHWIAPPGMRPLYAYQRRTVASMLQQELDPGASPDPLYIPIRGVDGAKTFWLQPSIMEILRELPMRSRAKGGILCEEMGTGKTCIVLGLIMATKGQLSAPEEAPWDAPERPVLTPLSYRHFRSAQFKQARVDARAKSHPSTSPSLVETLIHFIRASPDWLVTPTWATRLQEGHPHLWKAFARNLPFYHVYEHVPETTSPRRKGVKRGPRRVFLTTATLVVVPRAILEQWNSEINKHCDGGSIRNLMLDSGTSVPSVHELASSYDLVLITHEKFSAETTRCNPSQLYSWKLCECEEPEGEHQARVPYCECTVSKSVSPLVQIRWKRLVVDEGHASASRNNLARLAQELSVERRWIVSGTPTRNLMGLSLGNHGSDSAEAVNSIDEDDVASTLDDDASTDSEGLVYPCDGTGDEEKTPGHEINTTPPRGRRWTRVDRDDLNKLGDMITKFIGVPQFAHETDLFRKMVTAPLLDPSGPRFGAIQVVSQVMGQVMFRHQIQVVENELPEKLPPLKEKTVAFKFQPLAAKTYNVLQSGIAINAVDSERRDQDYLFHPRQRAQLRQTLENLTQTMFWHTDEELFDIDGAIERSEDALEKARKRNRPESDISLVEEAMRVQREAACDPLWRSAMKNGEMTFVLRGLPLAIQETWLKVAASLHNEGSLMDPGRICKLRHILVNSPLISEQRLVDRGRDVAREDEEKAAKYAEWLRSGKRKRKNAGDLPENKKLREAIMKAGSKEKLQELTEELNATIDRRQRGQVMTLPLLDSMARSNELFASRPFLISPTVGNSGSSKVNYILGKVLKHAAKEKFLIFSAFPLSLVYVGEALEVAHVPYLHYSSAPSIEPRARQQMVVTFETSDKYRVLLIELKLGARGLNLTTASRIIFCEPVWQGDIESQAIKRAQRIGQKAARIKVSTLVMQGTSEEAMVTRRRALQRKSQRLPAMEEDVGMKQFLQNPTFIGPENIKVADSPGLDIPLVPECPSKPMGEVGDREMDVEFEAPIHSSVSALQPATRENEEPPRKKPRVHW